MTVPEDVTEFITTNHPNGYCDDCIREALDLSQRQQVQQITSSIGNTEDYVRADGECWSCGNQKMVIRRA